MANKIVKWAVIGIGAYALLMASVVTLYPDSPDDMDWEDRQSYNKAQIAKLKLGTQREEVLNLLGSPDISEARNEDGEALQVMFYRTQHVKADGITTQNECTALLFVNDQLTQWGEGAYQDYLDR